MVSGIANAKVVGAAGVGWDSLTLLLPGIPVPSRCKTVGTQPCKVSLVFCTPSCLWGPLTALTQDSLVRVKLSAVDFFPLII